MISEPDARSYGPGKMPGAMGSAAWRARAGVLVLAGALAVHELRYLLAAHAPDEHSHAYMGPLVPLACALVVLAVAEFAVRLAQRHRIDDGALGAAGVRWFTASLMLLSIFVVQETAEGLLAHGHLDLTEALVIHGGWLAAPLSFAFGAFVALALRGARTLLMRAGRGRPRRQHACEATRPLAIGRVPSMAAIACHLAGRAPPSFVN